MIRKTALTARVAPELKRAIKELAKKDGRSAGQYVERILLAHITPKRPTPKRTRGPAG